MATGSRILWKGAIAFGLVHIPVSLHTATADHGVDFDWLDKRSMDPVGYKRINKKTGKEIDKTHIVKGVEVEDGQYVVVSDEEIAAAYPRSTQSIDIEAFVGAAEIPFVFLDRPYYLAPTGKGAKVYALLRETLAKTQRIGVARVVIQTKQHLAALVPVGPALVLNLLRWGADIKPWTELNLPAAGSKGAGLTEAELKMATQLVEDMTRPFKADDYRDSFTDEVMALVKRKVASGDTETVVPQAPVEAGGKTADIIDLTESLKRSLEGKAGGAAAPATARKTARAARPKSAPAKKRRTG
ncbi:Ku protein [Rhizobacter sp. Root404]|uniref:non-homologous end joining protein Ku n=1 Tax=Rhizobacter sp. Root404 TaxID=1736528 RepID=UPI0006F77BE3|nr:Ku protein [Rhizobacter sp. Root404]KQW36380.1 DNA-binding protein [Rhizobacter sp. Root404]